MQVGRRFLLLLVVVASVSLSGCATRVFHNKAFFSKDDKTKRSLAILPVNVVFTGAMPQNLTSEQQVKWEDAESKMVQDMLVHFYRTAKTKHPRATVTLVPVEESNKVLTENGISYRNAWDASANEAGRLTKANWILKVSVKKDRMMSELASMGVEMASVVLDNLLNDGETQLQGSGMAKTYQIYLEAKLIEASSGTVISTFIMQNDASWTNPPERILQRTSKRIVRRGAIKLIQEETL